jgi:phosphonate transport system permease protein
MASESLQLPRDTVIKPVDREELRERMLRPIPRIGIRTILIAIMIIAVYIWGVQGTKASPVELVAGMPAMGNLIARMFPPEFEMKASEFAVPGFLQGTFGESLNVSYPTILPYIVETLQMAIIGTTLAVVLSLFFALLAARNTTPHPWAYHSTRLLLNINRAVPDIIFALLFVAAVGLGPFGGVLALAIGAIGSMGKIYAESIESIDPQQVQAVRATGADDLQVFTFGVIPQVLPLIASYSIWLFEHNVRSATILGLVGAGGVGFILSKYISLFQYHNLMGALIMIIVMVTVIDRASDALRKRII